MAGHSKFKNIQHRKAAQDSKRAKVFTKLLREVVTAAKSGMPDPEFNPRLRMALAAARAANMPKANLENALKRATDPNSGENYDEMRYEGFGPGGVAIIVEALTDNRNRTASEVRAAFSKAGGMLGETGSVSYLFSQTGCITYDRPDLDPNIVIDAAIEVGANDVVSDENTHTIYTSVQELGGVRDALVQKFGDVSSSKLTWIPLNTTVIEDLELATKISKLVEALEDNDDVQEVYTNCDFSDDVAEKL